MKDKITGKSRGFGYITMKDSLIIEKILKSHPIIIEGKHVECKIAIPKDHLKENINFPMTSHLHSTNNTSNFENIDDKFPQIYPKKIFVGGLPNDVTDTEFYNYFKKFGSIVEFSIKFDKKTGNSRGFGFVIYKNPRSVELVLKEKNSHCMKGKWIDCKPAFQKDFLNNDQNDTQEENFVNTNKDNIDQIVNIKNNSFNNFINNDNCYNNEEFAYDQNMNYNCKRMANIKNKKILDSKDNNVNNINFLNQNYNDNKSKNVHCNNLTNNLILINTNKLNMNCNNINYPFNNVFSTNINQDNYNSYDNFNNIYYTNNNFEKNLIADDKYYNCLKNPNIQDHKSFYKNFFSKDISLNNNKENKKNESMQIKKDDINYLSQNNLIYFNNNEMSVNNTNFIDTKITNGEDENFICDEAELKIKTNDNILNFEGNNLNKFENKNSKLNLYYTDVNNNDIININSNYFSDLKKNKFPNIKDNFFESELVTAFFKSINESKEEKKINKIKLFNEENKDCELENNYDILEKFELLFNKRGKRINNKDRKEDEIYYGPQISNEKN